MQEIENADVNFIQFGAGATDSSMALELAYAVSNLDANEELIVLLDDADDVIFNSYESASKFRHAMQKDNPFYAQDVNLINQRNTYEKQGRHDLVKAIDAFTVPGKVGIHIPMHQVRFYVVCNRNLENKKEFGSKIYGAVEAIVDRVKYKRLEFEWKVAWGWLAYILQNNQPFPNHPLTDDQKYELTDWMWSKWENMRNTSYRTVEEMAESMINDPDSYKDEWESTFISKLQKKK